MPDLLKPITDIISEIYGANTMVKLLPSVLAVCALGQSEGICIGGEY